MILMRAIPDSPTPPRTAIVSVIKVGGIIAVGRSKKPFWARDYKKSAYNRAYYQKRKVQDKLTSVGIIVALGVMAYGWVFHKQDVTQKSHGATIAASTAQADTLDQSQPTPEQGRFWPDFSCSADHSKDSIATMLCQNSEAAKHELIFDQTYYALRQIVGKSGWKPLKQEVIADDEVLKECVAPDALDGTLPKADPQCYISKMDEITEKYKVRLSGSSLEEANRPIGQHIALQQKFIDLGYLPAGSIADGVYGEGTREAISTWQRVTHRPASNGFVSDGDVAALAGDTTATPLDITQPKQQFSAPLWSTKDEPGLGKTDVVYKSGPTEISIAAGMEESNPISTVVSVLVWGSLFSCEYHNDAELINDRGISLPMENEGCAPRGPRGTAFIAKLSPQNLSVFTGAKSLTIRQGSAELPVSTAGLSAAMEHLK